MIRLFVNHPNAANILMILLIVLGLVSAGGIVRSTFPQQVLDTVQVTVPYPGAAADEIDEAICYRLENAIDQVDQIREYRCESRNNLATLTIEGDEGLVVDRLLADVRTEIDAIDDLPTQSEPPIIRLLGTTDPVVSIAVFGKVPYYRLKDYAEEVKFRLQRLEGISGVKLQGFTDRQLRIELDALALRGLNLAVSDVAALLRSLNVDSPAGDLKSDSGSVTLRVEDERTNAGTLAELILRSPRGRPGYSFGRYRHHY